MNNRWPFVAVLAAIVLFLVYSSIFVVNARQQAIVLRFGEIVDVKTEPGIYFKLPFSFFDADTVQMLENRVLRFDLDNIRVQVSGGKFYEVDAFIAYRISDPRVFRAAVSGKIELAEARLRTRLDAALRRVYGLRDFAAYCKPRDGATTIRDLQLLTVTAGGDRATDGAGLLLIDVTADAFCHSMVRSLVGALLAVGEGRTAVERPAELLAAGRRTAEIAVAPAHGLTLMGVDYPPDADLVARAAQTRALRGPHR